MNPRMNGLNLTMLNRTEAVARASNKLKFFDAVVGQVSIPSFTTSQEVAKEWVNAGKTVICRTILNGHSGAGIVLADKPEEVVKAPLYTEYVPKKEEYRVHVFNGEVIHASRKARKKEIPDEEVNWKVRNHGNGFIFQHENFELPEDCAVQSIKAIEAVGLDFGAVDVIWNDKQQKSYVLEVNTAPGIEGTTLERYTEAINKWRDQNK